MKWFKFYGQDFFTDPKVMGFTVEQKLIWVGLLTLACAADDLSRDDRHTGAFDFVPVEKIMGMVGVEYGSPYWSENANFYDVLTELEMINISENGKKITIVNYDKRQDTNLTDAERAKRYRDKKKGDKSVTNVTKSSHNSNARLDKNRIDKNRINNNNITTAVAVADDLNSLIGMFKEVNPSYEKLYSNTTQRKALADMLSTHGRDKVEWSINFARRVYGKQYAPQITTPVQLEQKLGSLIAYAKSKEDEKPKIAVMPL